MASRKFVKSSILLIVAIIISLILIWRISHSNSHYPVTSDQSFHLNSQFSLNSTISYVELQMNYQSKQLNNAHSMLDITAQPYTRVSGDAQIENKKVKEQTSEVLNWSNDKGSVEWNVDVPEDGLYELEVGYYPLPGSYASIVRGIQFDGKYSFQEAEHIEFPRYWKDAKSTYDRNPLGDEIRPVQVEIAGWRQLILADYNVSSEPLKWHLTKGKHTMTIMGQKEPIAISTIKLIPPASIPLYKDYVNMVQSEPLKLQWSQLLEAEKFKQKSSTTIQTGSVSEPHVSPDTKGRLVYNVLGGDRWRNPGNWVEWEIEAPQSGYYEVDLKYFQGYNGNSNAYRTIMIDGRVPFQEMLHYSFPSNHQFRIMALQDRNNTPYQFYLDKGVHTIRMIADVSPMYSSILAINNTLREISLFDQDIRTITGNYGIGTMLNIDLNRTWDMNKFYPGIDGKVRGIADNLEAIEGYIDGLNQGKTDATTAISVAVSTLRNMQRNIDDIPNRVDEFAKIQSSLSTWMNQLSNQMVLLDYLVFRTPDTHLDLKEPTIWNRIPFAVVNFVRSFFLSYDLKDTNDKNAITIWVQRGRDYVDLMREMIDQDFTPATGIKVNLNLMPNPNALILGNSAGDQPDAALGIAAEMAGDYAMRDAVANLSKFEHFSDIEKRFNPGVMRSVEYRGGTYALPESQNFLILFYRTDILDSLDLRPPNTWDDVYKMLPTLQEHGMSFYYPNPSSEFNLLFYQHGAEYYTSDGLHTKLNDANALDAFKQWTELFSKYDLPRDVPVFLNHFRNGDIPIGISDFNTYIQLNTAAPEITGHWKIAPLPGIAQSNGTVVRWSTQPATTGIIMKKSNKQEEAWKFLDWWTSKKVQSQYGRDIESLYGIEYRWNTANMEALLTLPYPADDLAVIKEQARWAKNVPLVPGYYYLNREMTFAWNRTVVSKMPARESLMKAGLDVQRELIRKQEDLGITQNDNLQILPYDKPYNYGGSTP